MPNINDVLTPNAIKAYFDEYKRNVNTAPYLGEAMFPGVFQESLDMKFLTGEEDMPTVLKPTAYDAEVPLRDRVGVDLIQGEMPFYREGFLIKEVDRRLIQKANAAGDPVMKSAVAHIFKDMQRLVDGANSAAERMRWQILADANGSPKITINANGVNMVYNYDPNQKYYNNNYVALTGTSAWDQYSTSDPVKVLDTARQVMANKGVRITKAIMNRTTWNNVMQSVSLWNYALGTNASAGGVIYKSEDIAKAVIAANAKVEVIIYDKAFKSEAGSVTSYIPDNVVSLVPDGTLGETRYAMTPEGDKYIGSGDSLVNAVTVGTGIVITHKSYDVPVKEEIIAGQICMPSFEGMYTTYTIKTV